MMSVQAVCLAWLESELYPLALDAARLPRATSPAQVLSSRERRIECYDNTADTICDGLAIVASARVAAHLADDSRARGVRDAIVWLATAAAYEYAIAADLLADVPEGFGLPPDFVVREQQAQEVLDRWHALDEPVSRAWSRLVRELADAVRG